MTYRLPSERIELDLGADLPRVEVEPLGAWLIYQGALALSAAFAEAKTPAAEVDALQRLYRFFAAEALPSWDIADHRGAIAPTADGMVRLPLGLALAIVEGWIATFVAAHTSTAVDAVIPPGELRDALNAELRSKRRKKAA